MPANRVLTVLCATTLGVAALTGCGSEAGAATPTSIPSPNAAPDASTTATPAGGPTSAGVEITADNIVDVVSSRMVEAGSVQFAMVNERAGFSMKGVMEYTGAMPNARLTLAGRGMATLEMVVLDGVTYVNGGDMTQDKYVAFQEDDPESPFAGFAQGFDPSGTLVGLGDAISSVTALDETLIIDGALVRAYDVTIDTSELEPGTLSAETKLPDSLVYTYWITDDGSLHRVDMGLFGQQTTAVYSHWGEDLDIEAPAASEITDVSPF